MDAREAEATLADVEVIVVLESSLAGAKEVRDACLDADIAVMLWRDAHSCGKGCAPRVQLLAREEDVPRIAALLGARWRDMALREGTLEAHAARPTATDDEHPPCPACGAAAALVEGACPECGLMLG